MKISHKADALDTLSHARKILDDPAPLNPVRLAMLKGVIALAEEQVATIHELTRVRKAAAPSSQ